MEPLLSQSDFLRFSYVAAPKARAGAGAVKRLFCPHLEQITCQQHRAIPRIPRRTVSPLLSALSLFFLLRVLSLRSPRLRCESLSSLVYAAIEFGPMLYAVTIAASSLLLFLVQPMIAKAILPHYGGSAGVWVTCMLFFQVA